MMTIRLACWTRVSAKLGISPRLSKGSDSSSLTVGLVPRSFATERKNRWILD